jgi:CheY-like chemotaxis protein
MAVPPPLKLPNLDGLIVLVVEDDNDSLELLSTFVRVSGAEVLSARSATAGLGYIESAPRLDVVITDLEMPHIDGLEFVRRLRRHPTRGRLPVIAVTAFYEKHPKAEQFDAWLKKPVSLEELGAVLSSLTERGAAPA